MATLTCNKRTIKQLWTRQQVDSYKQIATRVV